MLPRREQEPPAPDPVAQGAHRDQGTGHEEAVDVDDPQQLGARRLQLGAHLGHGEVEHRQVHHVHRVPRVRARPGRSIRVGWPSRVLSLRESSNSAMLQNTMPNTVGFGEPLPTLTASPKAAAPRASESAAAGHPHVDWHARPSRHWLSTPPPCGRTFIAPWALHSTAWSDWHEVRSAFDLAQRLYVESFGDTTRTRSAASSTWRWSRFLADGQIRRGVEFVMAAMAAHFDGRVSVWAWDELHRFVDDCRLPTSCIRLKTSSHHMRRSGPCEGSPMSVSRIVGLSRSRHPVEPGISTARAGRLWWRQVGLRRQLLETGHTLRDG